MVLVAENISMKQYQSQDLLKLANRTPETYRRKITVNGNSILTTLYIKSMSVGAELTVNYYDDVSAQSENLLASHGALSGVTDYHSRLVVTEIHNSFIIEAVLTGGDAEFMVFTTIVDNFPLDLKGKLDGGDFISANDTGLPLMFLDRTTNKFYFASSNGGILQVIDAGFDTLGDDGELDLNSSTWTAIPVSPVSGQKSIILQNQSDTEMKFSFKNNLGYVGFRVQPDNSITYDITQNVIIYGRSASGINKKVFYQLIG